MGWPVAHSRSPALHGFWLNETRHRRRLCAACRCAPERLEQALRALPALGFRGCNLTIPHKQAALAGGRPGRPAGAAHRRDQHGHRRSRTAASKAATPMFSAFAKICASVPGLAPAAGAGGGARRRRVARAVIAALIDAGVREIRLVNRTLEPRRSSWRGSGDLPPPGSRFIPGIGRDAGAAQDAGLLVNTTSLGMAGEPALDLDLSLLPIVRGGRRYRLCAARDQAAGGGAAARPPRRRRARHAAASGPAGICGVVWRRGASHPRAARRRSSRR